MIEQFVLNEMMELNEDMSSMNLDIEDVVIIEDDECKVKEMNDPLNGVNENEKVELRRSQRKRIHSLGQRDFLASSAKMQRLIDNNNKSVEKYYMSKKVKRLPSTLETIFEEPILNDTYEQFISTRKFNRAIRFPEDISVASKLKVKKRKLKAKKLASSKAYLNRKKVSMDKLLNKLSTIEADD